MNKQEMLKIANAVSRSFDSNTRKNRDFDDGVIAVAMQLANMMEDIGFNRKEFLKAAQPKINP
jgi:hypothetical protein